MAFTKSKLPLMCLLGISLFATNLFADDLKWGGTWAAVWSGFGTSPYTAINKSDNNKTLVIFCLDYNDEIAPPFDWTANIRPLTQSNVDQHAQFGGNYGQGITAAPWSFTGDPGIAGHAVDLTASASAYTRYLEAAWLFTNILSAQANNDLNSMIVSQVAAWNLFVESRKALDLRTRIGNTNNPGVLYNFKNYNYSTDHYVTAPTTTAAGPLQFQDAVNEALIAAQSAVLNQSWYGSAFAPTWDLVTGDPGWTTAYGRPVQEFLTNMPPVPEPSSILLLATAVIGTIRIARRRARTRR